MTLFLLNQGSTGFLILKLSSDPESSASNEAIYNDELSPMINYWGCKKPAAFGSWTLASSEELHFEWARLFDRMHPKSFPWQFAAIDTKIHKGCRTRSTCLSGSSLLDFWGGFGVWTDENASSGSMGSGDIVLEEETGDIEIIVRVRAFQWSWGANAGRPGLGGLTRCSFFAAVF